MLEETLLFILLSPGFLLPVVGKRVTLALVGTYAFLFAVALYFKDRIPGLNQLDKRLGTKADSFENQTLVSVGTIGTMILKWIVIIFVILLIAGLIYASFSADTSGITGFFFIQGVFNMVGGLFSILLQLLGGGNN